MNHSTVLKSLLPIAKSVDPVANSKMAAALYYRKELLAIGTNKRKSHPFQNRFAKKEGCIFLHAETDCIKNFLKEHDVDFLRKCTMYVVRVKRKSSLHKGYIPGLAKPCEGCQRALATFGIKECIFTLNDDKEYGIL